LIDLILEDLKHYSEIYGTPKQPEKLLTMISSRVQADKELMGKYRPNGNFKAFKEALKAHIGRGGSERTDSEVVSLALAMMESDEGLDGIEPGRKL
jgi:hypothetical protein